MLVALHAVLADQSLGPGPLPWSGTLDENALAVELSPQALASAADAVGKIGTSLCLAVVKSGRLVLNSSFPAAQYNLRHGGGKYEGYETMSAGKTATATLIGAAVHQGLFNINTPLAQYGVQPHATWNRTSVDFWPNVTAWHLLTQTSGLGIYPPGSGVTYDSDHYIQHLTYLLNATAKINRTHVSAHAWATSQFAAKLGLPHFYAYQQGDPLNYG